MNMCFGFATRAVSAERRAPSKDGALRRAGIWGPAALDEKERGRCRSGGGSFVDLTEAAKGAARTRSFLMEKIVAALEFPGANAAPRRSLGRKLAYWVPPVLVVLNAIGGGLLDAFRWAPGMEVFHHLGYPDYFATLLGTAKVLGGIALVAPVPRTLREWAYAGLVFDATAAVFSILEVGDPLPHVIIPTLYLALTIVSFRAWRARSAAASPGGCSMELRIGQAPPRPSC
jgi:hypothetical protein